MEAVRADKIQVARMNITEELPQNLVTAERRGKLTSFATAMYPGSNAEGPQQG